MPTILALETSTELASAALLHGEQVFARESSGVQTHSQTILPMMQSLLAQAGITLAQCDAIAFGAGPGSFTGVRTACGIAQGLAFGADLPVIPIVTLQAMAQACREASGASEVLALLDARMDEIYWAQYHFSEGWRTVVEPSLSPASGILLSEDVTICGNGLSVYVANSAANSGLHLPIGNVQPDIMPHAKHVAQLARIEFIANRMVAPRDAQPIYLRNKVALTTMERLAKATA
jgi:tRNA threonylcarbamoyladenosine biosynthesis protein TsaB